MKTIIFASGNKGKVQEVQDLFKDTYFKIVALSELDGVPEIIENGSTFEENAFIKAELIFKHFNIPVIADDSGLEVDALGGMPGVISARYAGESCSYDDNNQKLISELSGLEEPYRARFVTCAVYWDGNKRFSVHGELNGEIVTIPKGNNGFGYDPVFKPEGFDATLAELTLDEKNAISHRARAFSKLKLRMIEETVDTL